MILLASETSQNETDALILIFLIFLPSKIIMWFNVF